MASDWEKVDAYVNGPADYEEIPELTEEFFARAVLMVNGKPLGGERPATMQGDERQITLWLDPAVVDGFRATGPGWQARINDVLRQWLARKAA